MIVGPQLGEDAAVLAFEGSYLVATSDPITFATEELGWYAVCVNSNDIAAMGAVPKWMLVALLLPAGATTEELVCDIMAQLERACEAFGIALCGGHTEVTAAVKQPVVVGTMLGVVSKKELVTSAGACAGDALILTKGLGIEATAIMAREGVARLKGKCDELLLEEARNYLNSPGISVLKEAQIAVAIGGVHAMHDVTEGGISTAVHELATASALGVVVYSDKLFCSSVTATLCQVFGLNPLGVIGSGALLIACQPEKSEALCEALAKADIHAECIGEFFSPEHGRWLQDVDGNKRPLPLFQIDEIAKIFQ